MDLAHGQLLTAAAVDVGARQHDEARAAARLERRHAVRRREHDGGRDDRAGAEEPPPTPPVLRVHGDDAGIARVGLAADDRLRSSRGGASSASPQPTTKQNSTVKLTNRITYPPSPRREAGLGLRRLLQQISGPAELPPEVGNVLTITARLTDFSQLIPPLTIDGCDSVHASEYFRGSGSDRVRG